MRPIWKWIIGIAVGLVVLAVIAGGVWAVTSRPGIITRIFLVGPRSNPTIPNSPNTSNGPYYGQRGMGPWMMPYGDRDYPRMPMMDRGGGFSPLRLIGGLIGFIFFIGLLTVLILGIIWLVRSLSRRPMVSAAATTTAVPPAAAAAETHACANCGHIVQNGWEFCPNCGTKQ